MTAWQWVGVILAGLVIEVPWLWAAFWVGSRNAKDAWVSIHIALVGFALVYGITSLITGEWVPW